MAAWCYCVWELGVEDSVTGAWLLSSSKRLQIVANPFHFLVFSPLFYTLFLSFFFLNFPFLFFAPLDFVPLSIPSRSPSADSGSMCMMNWVGTPAAQALPRVHGDTMRGKLSHSALRHDTLLLFMHTWNSLHCPHGLGSRTSASNMISQWFIHSIGALQDKYWFFFWGRNQCTYTYLQDSACKSGTVCKSPLAVRINCVQKRIPYGPKLICDETGLIYSIYQVELISCLAPWNQLYNKLRPCGSASRLKGI